MRKRSLMALTTCIVKHEYIPHIPQAALRHKQLTTDRSASINVRNVKLVNDNANAAMSTLKGISPHNDQKVHVLSVYAETFIDGINYNSEKRVCTSHTFHICTL